MGINYSKVGKRIKEKRVQCGYTQAQLAETCNISNVYVSRIETGSATISLEVLYSVSVALNTTPDFFLVDSIYTSKERITDEIAVLLKNCKPEQLHQIKKHIKAVIE